MSAKSPARTKTAVLADNPLDGEQLLLDALFGKARPATPKPREVEVSAPRRPQAVERQPKPQHYKIVSISLYNEDIERLDAMVRELKRRGYYKANKSQLIRHALAQLDLDSVPKEI